MKEEYATPDGLFADNLQSLEWRINSYMEAFLKKKFLAKKPKFLSRPKSLKIC